MKKTSKRQVTISVDLGTTNSCVAIMEGGIPVVIPNSEGKNTTPSIVAFLPNNERKIGDSAKRQAVTNSKHTIESIKRMMGHTFSEVTEDIKKSTYEVVNKNGFPFVKIDDREYSPQEISAMILQKMKVTAQEYLGDSVDVCKAVITVPAYFNDSQRQATKEAGEIAGLEVVRIINEPTAAALAYGLDKKGKELKVIVYDLGGGTYDASCMVLDPSSGVFEVKAVDGCSRLGGNDFDFRIVQWLCSEFEQENGIDLKKDPMALQRLKEAAEKAKIELSSSSSTEINLPYIMPVDGIPKHLVKTLSRAKFEQLCDDLIQSTIPPCEKILAAAGFKKEEIDEVILVGGSTRIVKIQEIVEKFFGKKPSKNVNPDEIVALGGAAMAGILSGEIKDVLLLDVTPLTLGIETMGGVMTPLIPANTTIPCSKNDVFSTASDNQPGVEIHVLQGERPMAKDNRSIGKFVLDGLPPARRGTVKINVSFDLDANGILSVSAKDEATGKSQHIKIEASSGLSDTEIARMKEEAAANADSDKKEKESIEKLNAADSLIFNTEKQLVELNDKLSEAHKTAISKPLNDLKDAHKAKDLAKIDTATAELSGAWQAASDEMYKATTATEGENVKSEATEKEPVDVEFEQVK